MVGLRRVRDHIPRKETVQDVMPFRREVVSVPKKAMVVCKLTSLADIVHLHIIVRL